MRKFILCFFCLVYLTSNAQLTFEKIITKGATEHGWSVIQTTDGGYAVLSSSIFNYPRIDWWLIKTDYKGDTLWTKTFRGFGDNFKADRALVQTPDGGYTFMIDRNGKIGLLHLSADGDSLWEKELCTGSGSSISPVSGHRYIICGGYASNFNTRVALTDSTGELIWERQYQLTPPNSGGSSRGWAVREAPDGGFIIAGSVTTIFLINHPFMLRIGPSGDSLWFQRYWYHLYMEDATAYSVDTVGSNAFYAGVYMSNIGQHAMVMKFDAQGDTIWTRVIYKTGQQSFLSVRTTDDGGVIACGLDRKSFSNDSTQLFLVKFSSSGNILWEKRIGNYENAYGASIDRTSDNGLIICGAAQQTATSSPNCLLIKTDNEGNITNIEDRNSIARLSVNPNPASNQIIFSIKKQDVISGRQIILYDIFGREVEVIDLLPGMTTYSMGVFNIPEGMYIAMFGSSEKIIWSEKIIIKR